MGEGEAAFMAPRNKKPNNTAESSSQAETVGLLEELPQTAAAVIYQCLDAHSRTALASVSRWARDLVLREVRSVKLQVRNAAPRKPLIRLLKRVCSAAQAGRLSLDMQAHGFGSSKSNVLLPLLAPAQQEGGWTSVGELKLKAFPGAKTLATLVAYALPALHSLVLENMSLTHADLSSLSACSQLSSMKLNSCQVQATGLDSITSPLSAVRSLRQLSVEGTSSSIVAGLTQLTRLSLIGPNQAEGLPREAEAQRVARITGVTQLQDLHLGYDAFEWPPPIDAELVVSLLTSLKQLTSLALGYEVGQPAFDALLTLAPQLTSFTCTGLRLKEDRSASPCTWRSLVITGDFGDEAPAYLPTGSLTRLVLPSVLELPSPRPTLALGVDDILGPDGMLEEAPELLQRGLTNVVRSPAWQQSGPRVHVNLLNDSFSSDMTPDLLRALPGALAPLASKEVSLSIVIPELLAGASVVQQLGGALGSRLWKLVLWECDLSDDFWPAVWAHLPGLQQLTVSDYVCGAISAEQLTSFCSHATRPLQLYLEHKLFSRVHAEGKLERRSGLPQVTVGAAGDMWSRGTWEWDAEARPPASCSM